MSSLLKYRSQSEIFFLDYLPDEFFMNLSEKERINFRELRENHMLIEKSKDRISSLKKEIKFKIEQIKKIEQHIGSPNMNLSYEGKLSKAKFFLKELIQTYHFSISVGLRYHNIKTKNKPKFYIRVKASNGTYKNIYVGGENDIKKILLSIYNSSFTDVNIKDLKEELKILYTVYVRYFVWKNNWDTFFSTKHTLQKVALWSDQIGTEKFRW